jgi:Nucleoside-diphosphate-sugar epimerases
MYIIVTGSSGFVGKNLVAELTRRFDKADISCLVRDNTHPHRVDHVRYFKINYFDKRSLLDCPAFEQVDYVYHIAGVTKSASRKDFWEGNVLPTANLLETLIQRNASPKRFVLVSSQSASGPSQDQNHYRSEDELDSPLEYYGQTKLEAEQLVKDHGHQIPYTIISSSSAYGPWDVDVYNLFKMTKSGINLLLGDAKQVVSIIYVNDLAKALVDSSLSKRTENQKYFVCNDEPVSWQEFQETIFNVLEKKKIDLPVPSSMLHIASYFGSIYSIISKKPVLLNRNKMLLSKPKYWIISNQKAKSDFGFACDHTLKQGIRETYAWYKEHEWL